MRKCDGACKFHVEPVVPVICYSDGNEGVCPTGEQGWDFNYCQEAIEEDRRRGYRFYLPPVE